MSPRTLAPVMRRIRNLVNRATLNLVDDDATMQAIQIDATKGETLDRVEHWQGYGFSAHPHAGGEVLLLSAGGTRAKPVAVAVADRRYRMAGLAGGEVAIYDDQGQSVLLGRDGIRIRAKALAIEGMDGGDCPVTLKGDLTMEGDLEVEGKITSTSGEDGINLTGDVWVDGSITATGPITGNTGG